MTSFRRNLIVSLLFTFCGGPALVLLLMPWYITHFQISETASLARNIAAVVLITIGLIPLFESIWRFVVVGQGTLMPAVPTEHLVVTGLYRYVRNPMYLGVVIALTGEALLFANSHMLVYLAIIWIIVHVFVCFYEEPRLASTHGEEYARFKKNVPRWIPRLAAWKP
jgi:protein-S-isoprenylcysteine O-methyltransferase Ste14